MRLLIDVKDASGNKIGEGPVMSAQGCTIGRELSATGSIFVSVPIADERALSLMTNKRRLAIYGWDTPGDERRTLGTGIIEEPSFNFSDGQFRSGFSGPDYLGELKDANTWIGWKQDNVAPGTVITALMTWANTELGLTSGWSAEVGDIAGYDPISVRFDGVSVLKALQAVVDQIGCHFRLSGDRSISVGPFGDASGLRVLQPQHVPQELLGNDDVILVDQLTITYKSVDIVNRIVVLGPGDAEAALTLKLATRTTPYTVQSMTRNGITLYYIEDAASIAAYGVIERTFQAKNIAALSNSTADLTNAANALYDLASAWLQRNAVLHDVYKISVKKTKANILPGQTARVDYKGLAYDEQGNPVKWVNLADDLWVISAAERVGLESSNVDLSLSTVDKAIMNEADVVIGMLEDLRIGGVVVKPYLSKDTINPPAEAIDSTHDVEFPLAFGNYTTKINQVIFRLRTRPFRTLASGGDHRHRVGNYITTSGTPNVQRRFVVAGNASGGNAFSIFLDALSTDPATDLYTFDSSGDLTFGIGDDTSTPVNINIYVDDVLVESGLAPAGGNLEHEVDITSYFSETGFQGDHTIKITCGSGQGQVIGEIEVRETIQSIAAVSI
jgi:hypothetical protein